MLLLGKNRLQLTHPWYETARQIKAFFLKDGDVQSSEIMNDQYSITLTVQSKEKAQALASLLKLRYDYGHLEGAVIVRDESGTLYKPMPVCNQDELFEAANVAFNGNGRVKQIEKPTNPLNPWYGKPVVAICEKAIIQYYNDDLMDAYSNANLSVATVLSNIAVTEFVESIKLFTTTELNRDVS